MLLLSNQSLVISTNVYYALGLLLHNYYIKQVDSKKLLWQLSVVSDICVARAYAPTSTYLSGNVRYYVCVTIKYLLCIMWSLEPGAVCMSQAYAMSVRSPMSDITVINHSDCKNA